METKAMGISEQIKRYGDVRGLMSRINYGSLYNEHLHQDPKKARGIDGVTKETYGKGIWTNLGNLLERMREYSYLPKPVKRTYIPKANGKMRPLGIPSYEDKLVQAAMARVLNEVYENIFISCSYGFRPGRGCHDAIRYIDRKVMRQPVNWVLEADIKGFFDHVDHEWLMKFLGHVIKDPVFLRYIKRFLKAGIMEQGKFSESIEGTPQGGIISPILANVYLHYVLDVWITYKVIPSLKGKAFYARYADDFVILLQSEKEAKEVMGLLKDRLAKFSLEVAEEKTRILPFGSRRGTSESFDFLGFTIYNGKSRKGKYQVKFRTCVKKLKTKLQIAKEWIYDNMHRGIEELLMAINRKYRGHCQYYGVNGNYQMLSKVWHYLKYITHYALRRRGQKHPISWEKFSEIWKTFIMKPKICVTIWGS